MDPLPAGSKKDGALYPVGVHLKDLKEVRDLLYKMQRPAIAPKVRFSELEGVRFNSPIWPLLLQLVYPHDW